MKIVLLDNFNRDTEPDVLVAENVLPFYGQKIVDFLNKREGNTSPHWFALKKDDYVLSKDLTDLV